MAEPALRERLVAHAAQMTADRGWSAVTMARLAEQVGVSRQTVYNEIGTKPALAEAMVLRELAVFLSRVDDAFIDQPDIIEAIRGAARSVLELASENPLLRAILSASQGAGNGGSNELLPLLTTQADALMETATVVIRQRLEPYRLPLSERQTAAGIDTVVRLVISHMMQPAAGPAETADDIAWIAGRVLTPGAAGARTAPAPPTP